MIQHRSKKADRFTRMKNGTQIIQTRTFLISCLPPTTIIGTSSGLAFLRIAMPTFKPPIAMIGVGTGLSSLASGVAAQVIAAMVKEMNGVQNSVQPIQMLLTGTANGGQHRS